MWKAALRSDLIEHGNLDRDAGETATCRLLNRAEDIDAVFVASDVMAADAMWAVQVVGKRVPDDVAIIGFDDSPLAASNTTPFVERQTTNRRDGSRNGPLVIEMSEAGVMASQQLVLDPALAVRESTCGGQLMKSLLKAEVL